MVALNKKHYILSIKRRQMQTNDAFLDILNVFLFIYLKICTFLVINIAFILPYCHDNFQLQVSEPFVEPDILQDLKMLSIFAMLI